MADNGKNIIIDFTEREESIYKPPGELAKLTVTGEVSIINTSETHRLWNIGLNLKSLEMIDSELTPEMKVGELNAQSKWFKSYEVKNEEIQTKTSLKITEIIDTYYEKGTEINQALVKDHQMPISFTISLENTIESTISNIKLLKNIPEEFGTPIIDSPPQGEARFDESSRNIVWDGFNLISGGVQSLIIRIGLKPEQTEPYNTGNIEVDYLVPNLIRSKLSGITTALSDSMFSIDQGESLDEPGEWECTAEFENISDFVVELKKVQVSQVTEGLKELVVEETPNAQLFPESSWKKDFKVKSGVVPKFSSFHDYLVIPKVTNKIIGHILYEAGVLPVASIAIEKILDPPAVSAYTKTPIKVSLLVTNTGSAVLNEFIFRDIIPRDNIPPELNDILVYLNKAELRSGVEREINPNDINPESMHTLIVKLIGLSTESGIRGLQPEEEIMVTYPLKSYDPKPKIQYPCPLEVIANVYPPGPPIKPPIFETEINIKYVRRRISAKKGQTPGSEPGEYIIPIIFENKGEVLIENITLKDIVPLNFSLLDWNPKDMVPERQETERGTILIWKIDSAEPGKLIKFSYTIKGTGEYVREELEVHIG
ncbi:MAG: hypothetical protein ACFFD2_09805 [Promethearchaeota archaeon]